MERNSVILRNGPRISKCCFALKEFNDKKTSNTLLEHVPCEYSYGINYQKEYKIIEILISAKINDEDLPFKLEVVTDGQVEINKLVDESEAYKIGLLFGGPYLFAILKDFVMEITRKAFLNPFIIPPINFDELVFSDSVSENNDSE